MQGFPKYFGTKQDVLNCMDDFAKETKNFLQELLDTKDVWIMTNKLDTSDNGIVDDTHKVVEVTDNITAEIKEKYQYELMEDRNGTIFRLGFSVQEVEELVK